jgi:hypothetical protein
MMQKKGVMTIYTIVWDATHLLATVMVYIRTRPNSPDHLEEKPEE